MTKKTGTKWKTDRCGRCEKPHRGYSGKIDSKGVEYVVCEETHKKMNTSPSCIKDIVFSTVWVRDI